MLSFEQLKKGVVVALFSAVTPTLPVNWLAVKMPSEFFFTTLSGLG